MKTNHNNFLKIAFNIAMLNLGKTNSNPSVGCVVVKDNTVISSGCTSIGGRPHSEFNALNFNKDFKNSDLYVTMEPCSHQGLTPPCTDIIIKKGIKRVFFSFYDVDQRTAHKIKISLKKKKIKFYKKKIDVFKSFYQSYFLTKKKDIPFIDAKVALSKDYYTISKNTKWITNTFSRDRVHLIRSQYDSIISTSKTINKDNSLLNCRLNGCNNNKPDLIIIDLNLRIKKNLNLFKKFKKRKILIVTKITKSNKILYFKKKGLKFIFVNALDDKTDFINLFIKLKKLGYYRILVESGLIFLNELMKKKLISNLFMFQSSVRLGKKGSNNTSNNILKKLKLNKRVKVNLNNDNLYKINIK
jgi:diaminohydroxyphosphoribosylaminopyrimidine deaminase/5-amino-6-(5-phosphoribosylamino)uracil reductase